MSGESQFKGFMLLCSALETVCLKQRQERKELNFNNSEGELQLAVLQHELMSVPYISKNNEQQQRICLGMPIKFKMCLLSCHSRLHSTRCMASAVKCVDTQLTGSLSTRWWWGQHLVMGDELNVNYTVYQFSGGSSGWREQSWWWSLSPLLLNSY